MNAERGMRNSLDDSPDSYRHTTHNEMDSAFRVSHSAFATAPVATPTGRGYDLYGQAHFVTAGSKRRPSTPLTRSWLRSRLRAHTSHLSTTAVRNRSRAG